MAIKKDILDQLLAGRDPKDAFAKDGLLDDLKKALLVDGTLSSKEFAACFGVTKAILYRHFGSGQ